MSDSSTHRLSGSYGAAVKHGGGALTSASGARSSIFPGSPAGSAIPANTGTVRTNALFAAATTNLTVEAWIKPATLNGTGYLVPLVSYGREIQGQPWVLQMTQQSKLDFWIKSSAGRLPYYDVQSNTSMSPAKTYHVVATYNGTSAKLYINGALETTVAASGRLDYAGLIPSWGLALGGALGGSEPTFNGAISDVAIYPTALTPADIQNHYAVGAVSAVSATPAPTPAPSSDSYTSVVNASHPLTYYKLNDSGSKLSDSGTNQLAGTYGTNVRRGSAALTSSGDPSATFPGSAAGSDIAANSATVPSDETFTKPTTALTVEAWIKPSDYNRTNNYVSILSYGRQVIGNAWSLQVTPQSTLTFQLKAGSGYLLAPVTSLTPGQVYHVVATYNGSSAKLYVNGSLGSSTAASGTIDYTGIRTQDGLGIGGSLGGTLPIFNGAINDVAIYPTALSAADVQKHYLTGEIAIMAQETPTSSDAFVNSIGVVTHLRTSGSPYTASFATFESLIKASGIRHIGDALVSTPAWYPQRVKQLASDGIHASLISNVGQTAREITSTIAAFGNAVEAVEGLNEPDVFGDSNWVASTRSFQKFLWSTVKGNSATANLPVTGPSLVSLDAHTKLGDLSAYMNSGAIHDYFNAFNPGTSGWGSLTQYGIYGSISFNKNVGAIVSGNKPVLATETGYGSLSASPASIDNRTLSRYVPRLYLEHFLHGISRTTAYEFYDEPGTGSFNNFGLVGVNNTPKSSYYALKSLIAALADPGATYAPKSLAYLVSGNVNNLHHLLLQKRDGTFVLVLWLEVESFDPDRRIDIAVPPQTITLQPATTPRSGSIATIGDAGNISTTSLSFPSGIASIPVDDRVTIVSFK